MSDIGEQNLSKEETWKAHLMKAEVSRMSDKKYCLKHDLNPGVFRAYKKKLGFTKPRKRAPIEAASAFVKVAAPPAQDSVNTRESRPAVPVGAVLPDPAWLAELIRTLMVMR